MKLALSLAYPSRHGIVVTQLMYRAVLKRDFLALAHVENCKGRRGSRPNETMQSC